MILMKISKDEYVSQCWKAAQIYCEGVESGSIKTCENIRLAVSNHTKDLLREDLEWRQEAVAKVFKFFYYLFVDKNTRFTLQGFQAFLIMVLFGYYYKGSNDRRYQNAFLFMGRKNGKTCLAGALQLYFLMKDDASFPESVLITGSKDQTGDTSFKALEQLIEYSPAIQRRLSIMRSQEIVFKKDEFGHRAIGKCKVLTSIPDKSEGLNPTSCILDEIHTYKDSKKFSVIKNALGTKPNPMLFFISTAGFGKDSFCAQLVETGRNVLRGLADDDRFFYLLYELEEGDDIDNEEVWIKANPGLGTILNSRSFKDQYNTAKTIPTTLDEFITKKFNLFLEEQGEWIPSRVLTPRFLPFEESVVKDLPCYVGVDLSETQDLTSIVCLWVDKDKDIFYVKSFFFFVRCENNSLRRGNININNWVKAGYIIECKTPTIDFNLVKEYLNDIAKKYKVKALYFDPWHFREILNVPRDSKGATLKFEDGTSLWCIPVAPGTRSFDYPMRYTEGLFYGNKIIISPNKCMLWNFLNVVKAKDMNGNFRPDKKKSKEAIDGVVSLLNCLYGVLGMNTNAAAIFMKQMQN